MSQNDNDKSNISIEKRVEDSKVKRLHQQTGTKARYINV